MGYEPKARLPRYVFLRRLGRRRLIIVGLFALAYFFSYFLRSANAVIAKDLAEEFSLSAGDLGLMTGLFFAVFAAIQIPIGGALDRVGPRWVTPGLMLLSAVGCLIYALAGGFGMLALGRVLMGAGMGGVLMGAYKALSQWFSEGRFATAAGIVVGLGATGALATGTPLAWAAQTYGWRAVFIVSALGVLAVALAIVVWVRNTPPGASWPVEGAREARLGEVLRDSRFWRIAPVNLAVVGTFLAFQGLWAGPYLMDVLGVSQLQAGNAITVAAVGGLIGYFSCGWLADSLGHRRVVVLGVSVFICAQAALVAVGVIAGSRGPQGLVSAAYASYFAFGFGGAFNIILMAHTRVLFPTYLTGRAVTAVNMFGVGGTALVQWSLGLVIESFGRDAAGHYPPEAYALSFGITACICLAALLWYATMRRATSRVSL